MHPSRRTAALLGTLTCALVVSACGGESAGSSASQTPSVPTTVPASSPTPVPSVTFPVTVTDGGGVEHTFDKPVSKIGCLYYGCVEILADLGIVPNASLSGDDTKSVFFYPLGPPAHQIKDEVSPEQWAKSGSDVIIDLAGPLGDDDAKALGSVAPVVFLTAPYKVWDPKNSVPGVQAWRSDLELLGQITGKPEAAQAALDRYDAVIARLRELAPAGAATQQVANLSFTDDGTYSLMDPDSPFCEALATNGLGTCTKIDGWSADTWEVNAEAFLAADPPMIAYTVYDDSQSYKDRDDPVWKRLTAVKDGNVFDFSRTNCCSLRMLEHSLQEYAFHAWGPGSGVPDPGPESAFDPTKSALLGGG